MSKFRLLMTVVFASVILASCNDDFLDKRPTSFISNADLGETALINPEIVEANLRGIFNQMITAGIGGTGSQEDFGWKSFDLMSDLLSSDLAQVGAAYNRFVGLANLVWTTDRTINLPNYTAWRFYYRIINSANLIIDSNGGNDVVPTNPGVAGVLGQAKAMRAICYWYLTQYYQVEYNPTEEILPIYTEPGMPGQPKSPASDVYDLIIKDFTDAISFLNGYQRPNKAFLNQNVAKGYLAYVYASMGGSANNQKAIQLTKEVIDSGEFPMMSRDEVVLSGFNDLSTPGWMWGFDLTVANGANLLSWAGFMCYYSYSYQAVGNYRGIDSDLYAQIDANDIRRHQFGAPGVPYDIREGAYPLIPVGKFYNENFVHFGQNPMTDDYVYMRVTEMYLLNAELNAVEGNTAAARTMLKAVLANRMASPADYAYVDGLSGQALVDDIVFHERVEFLAEGKAYLLMKRRKLTKTRGANHLNRAGESFAHNDPRLTFEIHQRELTDNPMITDGNK
ncbi:MAG: RagB/SusD family nutrient uptake outer membrane protein [Flavobacteriaceae bacterium]|nr:RagB/SusD family nutrient uptake outer membrane protein [Flavobacteriaceae bacterium]